MVHTIDGRTIPYDEYRAEARRDYEAMRAQACSCGHRRGQHHGVFGLRECAECSCDAFIEADR
jgi:hypothetical protein